MNQTIDDASKNMEEIEDDVLQPEKVIFHPWNFDSKFLVFYTQEAKTCEV